MTTITRIERQITFINFGIFYQWDFRFSLLSDAWGPMKGNTYLNKSAATNCRFVQVCITFCWALDMANGVFLVSLLLTLNIFNILF